MKARHTLVILFAVLLAAACNGPDDPGRNTARTDIWTHTKPMVAKVEVSSEGTLLETFEYTYDENGRMLTLVKTDKLSKTVMLELEYTYPGENVMKVSGKFFPISTNRFISATYNPKDGTLDYVGSWKGAWSYTTTVGEDGVAIATVCKDSFAAKEGYYTSDMDYGEEYTISGGTIVAMEAGTDISAQSSKATRTANSSSLKTVYTAGDKADSQNFAAYLMPCNFPVWIAAGLPGNKHLVTGISSFTGNVSTPESTAVEYTFNPDGSLDTAVRTDSNAGTPYLTRTYKFIYQ